MWRSAPVIRSRLPVGFNNQPRSRLRPIFRFSGHLLSTETRNNYILFSQYSQETS